VDHSYRVFVLTGAVIQAPIAGVRPSATTGGLWEEHRIEDVATPKVRSWYAVFVSWRFYSEAQESSQRPPQSRRTSALARL